ncbi:hypothetical protein PCC6912_39540 [Chlorogloeopsis fritschii PCC 6912]|uniref:Uncharacterized protein n=1 Tax=Chlorogloeopsis fritschii PCC 6912 TaxID=211165 RepID=A0A433N6A7_CHLFR|nr:hypothetical protein [Chlorogloeopsis fritschii]RUR76995.1 hypothetical protein PCC6912_39540 [Chlorogloeopsis fritschii PCC 6912]
MNKDNPNVIPGKYDPQSQSKTEIYDWVSMMMPGYVDPTQVPMEPGDTQVPKDRLRSHNNLTPQNGNSSHPQQMRMPQQIPIQHEDEHASPPNNPLFPREKVDAFIKENETGVLEKLKNLLIANSDRNSQPTPVTPGEVIKIPIVIELTINLKINHQEK